MQPLKVVKSILFLLLLVVAAPVLAILAWVTSSVEKLQAKESSDTVEAQNSNTEELEGVESDN